MTSGPDSSGWRPDSAALVDSACSSVPSGAPPRARRPPPLNPNPRLGEEGPNLRRRRGGEMSAKKGLSSTLRNLKFMQRAAVAQKIEEKADAEVEMEAEVVAPVTNGGGVAALSVQVARKCVVVMEGNPHPGAVKGRMSFQNFNPTIDKLNDEASGRSTQAASPSNSHQDSANTSRTDDVSASRFRGFNIDSSESISLNELKRKEPELDMETPPSRRQPKTVGQDMDGQSSKQSNGFGSRKSNKREKLDYNLLRPRKSK